MNPAHLYDDEPPLKFALYPKALPGEYVPGDWIACPLTKLMMPFDTAGFPVFVHSGSTQASSNKMNVELPLLTDAAAGLPGLGES